MFESTLNIEKWGVGNSFVHNIHPAAKVFIALTAIILNALISSQKFSIIIIIIFVMLLILSKSSIKRIIQAQLIIFYISIGFFLTYGIFLGFSFEVYARLFINLTSMSMPMFFLFFTSPILKTLYGFECLIYPLNYLKLPVNAIVLICTIALSFIPILLSEVQRILYAMAVRGKDIRYAKLKDKAKIAISVLIPLLISTLKRCETLANAITVKNYEATNKRTNILAQRWKVSDCFVTILLFLALLAPLFIIQK